MEEKIKIYVSADIDNTLTRDADFFEFYKKDRSLNRNDFLNTLIVNYFDSYSQADEHLQEKLENVLAGQLRFDSEVPELCEQIISAVKDYQYSSAESRTDVTISLKPTRRSAGIIEFIQANCLQAVSLSGYFRNMFASYCSLPQDRREQIIFKEKFTVINQAINEGKMIYFTTSKSAERHDAAPYAISRSQEELFNYLICYYNGQPFSFRMTRIRNIRILNRPAEIPEDKRQLLERMRQAPQFAFNSPGEICVMLTEKGRNLFNKIYSYRPKPTSIIKGLYYFDCSPEQIFHYFIRFGKDAKIIYPESLRLQMLSFYRQGAEACSAGHKG